MKFVLKRLCAFLLMSLLGMASTLAEPQQNKAEGKSFFDRKGNAADQERGSGRSGQEGREGQEESGRKASRLSPEERKTLRQQINEAGHDLNHRKH